MSSAAAVGVFLAEKNRAYREGYAARQAGSPISAYDAAGPYVGPFGREGWIDGWYDADQGRPNKLAPSHRRSTKRLWLTIALAIGCLLLLSWL